MFFLHFYKKNDHQTRMRATMGGIGKMRHAIGLLRLVFLRSKTSIYFQAVFSCSTNSIEARGLVRSSRFLCLFPHGSFVQQDESEKRNESEKRRITQKHGGSLAFGRSFSMANGSFLNQTHRHQ